VIRQYHGHLSGVYSIALHPRLDVFMTGGRDSVCRVWDMRTKLQVGRHGCGFSNALPLFQTMAFSCTTELI
jgi:WD40 repeat protein